MAEEFVNKEVFDARMDRMEALNENIVIQDAAEIDPNLLRMLDRGLEDIEAGRTLPHREAMNEVRCIREARRFARTNTGVAVNA